MDIVELIDRAGVFVAIAATLAFILLLPLYFSQRRDLARLRDWMEREPDHPREDLAASEGILDRAEAELEALTAEAGIADTEVRPPTQLSPAERVRGERPALERITMERAALDPHPRWHRFTQGRDTDKGARGRSAWSRWWSGWGRSSAPSNCSPTATREGAGGPSIRPRSRWRC